MASVVDICNTALSHIGQDATLTAISPPDGSSEADHCARFYPIARDAMIERHTWAFATRREYLAVVTNPLDSWEYAYALPSECLRPVAILLPDSTDDSDTQDFVIEIDSDGNKVLYTNVEDAQLRYVKSISDTTKFPNLFMIAVSWLLAHFIAGPVTKNLQLKAECLKSSEYYLGLAMSADGNGQKNNAYGERHVPGHLQARL